MRFITEIPLDQTATDAGRSDADACLVTGADGLKADMAKYGPSRLPTFLRVTGSGFDLEKFSNLPPGFAIDTAKGQPDLDRASAALRVIEAKAGLDDGKIRLIAFRYSDLASLADQAQSFSGLQRLFALAHDDERLQGELPSGETLNPAPLIYARARLVADAKKIGCAAYLKPRWTGDAATNHSIIQHAKADGFDGLIGPPAMASMIKNA